MIRGNKIEHQVYDPSHRQQVLAEMTKNFPAYFETFSLKPLDQVFAEHIRKHAQEQDAYRDYMDRIALDEFDYDAAAFKGHTKKRCPIIRRCLQANDEVMKDYKISFNNVTGRQLLDTVSKLSDFAVAYVANFNDQVHEAASTPGDLGLNNLNESEYGCGGVIGYGIQSSLLYGVYPRNFAHRSQNAVWSLYFLSGRKDFGLLDGSEFLMAHPDLGTCEQNYFYPAELFAFYALHIYRLLKEASAKAGIHFHDHNRYIYLSAFCDHVGDRHRNDINTYRRSSEYADTHWF
ncbi:MAG: hypothetical protein H6667_25560 [Ardenticatenaceae bacterium]|nr:hypothetical protein [Ardenticatenaceae bacterium]